MISFEKKNKMESANVFKKTPNDKRDALIAKESANKPKK